MVETDALELRDGAAQRGTYEGRGTLVADLVHVPGEGEGEGEGEG